jgi:SAM-dependent methyltransferase
MVAKSTLLHQDDGLVSTRIPGERLADLELEVLSRFLSSKGRILDIGCGHGRACRHLGVEGFEAVGIELDSDTLREGRLSDRDSGSVPEFVLADGRRLCFRDSSFDYAISLASTLSEKHRLWMSREDRVSLIREGVRAVKPGGLLIVNFVHRYWSLKSFFSFFGNYWMWIREKAAGKKTELGDYVEKIGRTPIRFHAFTIREAESLFPKKDIRLEVWRRGRGPFTDWFFIIAKKAS